VIEMKLVDAIRGDGQFCCPDCKSVVQDLVKVSKDFADGIVRGYGQLDLEFRCPSCTCGWQLRLDMTPGGLITKARRESPAKLQARNG
jgi:hypothetical protein